MLEEGINIHSPLSCHYTWRPFTIQNTNEGLQENIPPCLHYYRRSPRETHHHIHPRTHIMSPAPTLPLDDATKEDHDDGVLSLPGQHMLGFQPGNKRRGILTSHQEVDRLRNAIVVKVDVKSRSFPNSRVPSNPSSKPSKSGGT